MAGGELRLPPLVLPADFRRCHTLPGPSSDEVRPELSHHPEHVEQQPADRIGRVVDRSAEVEAHPTTCQLFGDVSRISQRSREPVVTLAQGSARCRWAMKPSVWRVAWVGRSWPASTTASPNGASGSHSRTRFAASRPTLVLHGVKERTTCPRRRPGSRRKLTGHRCREPADARGNAGTRLCADPTPRLGESGLGSVKATSAARWVRGSLRRGGVSSLEAA